MRSERKYMDSPMGQALQAEEAKRGYDMAVYEQALWLRDNFEQIATLDEAFAIARAELIVREKIQ